VALRTGIAAIVLFAITAWWGRVAPPRREDLPIVLSIALLHMVGFSLLMAIGLMVIPTGRSVVLAYTTPLWVTPGASLFLHERLTPRRAAGVVMAARRFSSCRGRRCSPRPSSCPWPLPCMACPRRAGMRRWS
jgi:drug/metabolite transporter (DMT)-like permease